MSIKLHGVTSQQGTHITAVRSSDLNHKQKTPSDLFKDTLTNYSHIQQLGKGKTIPLQAWTGPEGSRRSRVLDFKTIST